MSSGTGQINPFDPLTPFNSSVILLSGTSLTLADAQELFLPLSGGIETGLLTCNASLSVNGSLTLNGTVYEDLTIPAYCTGVTTLGTAQASKVLTVDASRNVINIASLTATTINGTLATASQPNITSLSLGLKLGDSADTSRAISAIKTSMATNNRLHYSVGQANSTKNQAEFGFCYVGAGSDSNFAIMGLHTRETIKAFGDNHVEMLGNLQIAGTLTGVTTLTATTLAGTLSTASQPNITSLGTLTSLTVSGALNATLSTASQPNITSTGTLTSLTVSGALNATLSTASQPNITSTGTLTTLAISGSITSVTNITMTGTITGASSISATTLTGTLSTASQPNITSTGTLTSLTVSGALNATLATASQPNITSIGTLTSLTVSGALNATLSTASQPNVTSLGTLTSLTVSGTANNTFTNTGTSNNTTTPLYLAHDTGAIGGVGLGASIIYKLNGTASSALFNAVSLNATLTSGTQNNSALNVYLTYNNVAFSGMSLTATGSSTATLTVATLTATTINGTLATASQPNITSTGTLTTLAISGSITSLTNITMSGTITGASSISATTLTGTLSTASQTNITLLGNLTELTLNGTTYTDLTPVVVPAYCQSVTTLGTAQAEKVLTSDASLNTTGINILTATTINGTLNTGSQPNITNLSLGLKMGTSAVPATQIAISALDSALSVGNKLYYTVGQGQTSKNQAEFGFYYAGPASNSNYAIMSLNGLTIIKAFGNNNVEMAGALTINGILSGVTTLTATTLAGTLSTASQPNITSLGTHGVSTTINNNDIFINNTGYVGIGTNSVFRWLEINQQSANNGIRLNYTVGSVNSEIYCNSSGYSVITGGLVATLQTASQPNITSLGTLTTLAISGSITSLTNITMTGTITGASSISATTLTGTLSTPTQSGITSIGTLTTLAISGSITSLTNITMTGTITGATSISATTIAGTLSTASQPNITNLSLGLKIGDSTDTSRAISAIKTSMASGNLLHLTVGQANSTKNQAEFGFKYIGAGSDSNYAVMGLHTREVIKAFGDYHVETAGNLAITGTLTGVTTLTAQSVAITNGTLNLSTFTNVNNTIVITNNSAPSSINGMACYFIGASSTGFINAYNYVLSQQQNLNINNNAVYCKADGKVGINHTSPTYNLDINGSLYATDATYAGTFENKVNTDTVQYPIILKHNKGATAGVGFGVGCQYSITRYDTTALFNAGAVDVSLTSASSNDTKMNFYVAYATASFNAMQLTATASNSATLAVARLNGTTDIQYNGTSISPGNLTSITAGTCSASKALIVDASKDITGIRNIGADYLYGRVIADTYMMISRNGANVPTSGSGGNLRSNNADMWMEHYSNYGTSTKGNIVLSANIVKIDGTGVGNNYLMEVGYNTQTLGTYAYLNSAGSVGTTSSGGATNYSMRTAGRIACAGEINVFSDKRLKSNIQDIELSRCLEIVNNVQPKTFYKKSETKLSVGVIAQDLVKIDCFDLIDIHKDETVHDTDNDDKLTPEGVSFSVNYGGLSAVLLKVVKDQEERIKRLEDLIRVFRCHATKNDFQQS